MHLNASPNENSSFGVSMYVRNNMFSAQPRTSRNDECAF